MKKFETFQALDEAWQTKSMLLEEDTPSYQVFFWDTSSGKTEFYAWYYVDCGMGEVINDIEKHFPNASTVSLNYILLDKNVAKSD